MERLLSDIYEKEREIALDFRYVKPSDIVRLFHCFQSFVSQRIHS
jgi:hypothetical protein